MTNLSDEFAGMLKAHPQKMVAVIIRTTIPPTEAAQKLKAHGCSITQTFSLIRAVAATASAETILQLQTVEWISHIEPDSPVHTT